MLAQMANAFVENLCPPALRRLLNRMLGAQTRYRGPFSDWNSAAAATGGYDEGAILERVADATRRVLQGEAGYEQDGKLRLGIAPPSHALSALLLAAARDGGRLSVVDFGGGLGSHFLRWRPMLRQLTDLHWCVVEQPAFVEAGARIFDGVSDIAFVDAIDAAGNRAPNAVFASGVLQYLPEPYAYLDRLISLGADIFVLDRTPFAREGADRILTQHVPPSLGRASYPLRMFGRDAIESRLRSRYRCALEFDSGDAPIELPDGGADYVGQVWIRTP
jgi:putative methyltransferase (TIGR04325 family)